MKRFPEARQAVIEAIARARRRPETELVPLEQAAGRVLASPVAADRDYPPFNRATRDGFAVRSADVAGVPARLRVVAEVRAGASFDGRLADGECVGIMTGAPVPAGADAVVMVEHTRAAETLAAVEEPGAVIVERSVKAGENVVPRGSEIRAGAEAVPAARRLGYPEVAMLASFGVDPVNVFRKPRVAILPTGDEVVEVGQPPQPYQIRNSNSYSLRVQVASAGGEPCPLGIAPDEPEALRRLIEQGLRHHLLLLSGGVSMGKYDLVEQVLRELGAEFFFDAVAIQPGRPLVFGRVGNTFFFGLPGNPLSTMVTFELFARPALEMLGGLDASPLLFLRARLLKTVRHKPGLTRFLPAALKPVGDRGAAGCDAAVELVQWQGSGDIASLLRANCFLVVPEFREELPAGEMVQVLPR